LPKTDDSSFDPDDRQFVENRAKRLLDRADAWGRFPTRVDDLMEAAELKVAASSIFDPAAIMAYALAKGAQAGHAIKSAIEKVLGLYDPEEKTVHIDPTVNQSRQTFLKLHEAGHHELPAHRRIFRFFQDCTQTLHPDIADQFEREANNFARYALFQGGTFAMIADDHALEIKSVTKLSRKFGASVYASAREFARTNRRSCLVYVLEQPTYGPNGFGAVVRRIETSPSFAKRFGIPADTEITAEHALAKLLPIGRKMTRPTEFVVIDRNGEPQRVIGEALDTTFNILILIYAFADLPVQTETAGFVTRAG
jgi:hypothetical protein